MATVIPVQDTSFLETSEVDTEEPVAVESIDTIDNDVIEGSRKDSLSAIDELELAPK